MSRPAERRALPIFARTFLLLLAALVVAYAIGIALLALRKPPPAVRMSEVVALLTSRMPSDNPLLRVRLAAQPPVLEPGYTSPPPLRTLLAQWLDVPEAQVRFHVAGPGSMMPPMRRMEAATADAVPFDPWSLLVPAAMAQPAPGPGAGAVIVQRRDRTMPAQGATFGRARDLRDASRRQGHFQWRSPGARDDAAPSQDIAPAPAAPVEEAPVTAANDEPWPTRPPPDPATAYLRQYLPPYARIAPPATASAPPVDPAPTPAEAAPPRIASAPARAQPEAAVRVGEPQALVEPEPREPFWRADSSLPFAFLAAVRQADGQWRVVERVRTGPGIGQTIALMFGIGLLVLLPLAWWFSRALAEPIRRFAVAADRMGGDADAPPVPLEGPGEIVRAAASFNAMQARINRLVRERTQMVAAIAHDLRTPLARLSFRLDQLPAGAREKAAADIAEMSEMIQAALEFIREQHRNGLRERFDLRLLVESVVDELADVGSDIALAPGSRAPLHGDPLALRRMVGNLVDNALKYGTRARVSLAEDADGYALHIDDDGPGIDPARSEQLFMPFVRGETSRNRETGGIGLGLASARGIVLAHGGEIRLHNRSEGGLRATVTLPRSVPSPRPSPAIMRR
ncbi:MAG TPA: ATP-binding protein [Lysobacter sp.]